MILNKLEELERQNNLEKENILQQMSKEDLIFLLTEQMAQEPNYNNLYGYFEELREITIEKNGINIFEESLNLKFFYLNNVYGVPDILMIALLKVLGPVVLDYYLEEEFLKDDKFFKYYLAKHKEYKQSNEITIFKLLEKFDLGLLSEEAKKLEFIGEELVSKLASKE